MPSFQRITSSSLGSQIFAALLALGQALGCTPRVLPAGHTVSADSVPPGSPTSLAAPSSSASGLGAEEDFIAPPPPPLYAEIPENGSLIGKPGGIALEAISETGHWVAYCSAAHPGQDVLTSTRGAAISDIQLFLQIGEGTEAIDDLLAVDPHGRFLIIQKERDVLLIDAIRGQRFDLGELKPDLRRDALPDHRSFAFFDGGLFVLTSSGKPLFVPLPDELASDAFDPRRAQDVAVGTRPIWRVSAEGRHLFVHTLPEGSTTGSWPVRETQVAVHRCGSPHHPYQAFSKVSAYYPFLDLEVSWAYLDPKVAAPVEPLQLDPAPGFVMPFRKGWVRRQDSGRLLMVEGATQKQIASERCGARILHADEVTGLFLISCEHYTPVAEKTSNKKKRKPEYRFELYLVRPGYVRNLHADVARTGIDVKGEQGTRFVPLRPGATAALVDFKERKLTELAEGSFVVAVGRAGALLRRNQRLLYWTPSGEKDLPQKVTSLTPVLRAREVAVVDQTLYRLADSLISEELSHPPLFVTASGYALIPKESGNLERWPRGPMLLLPPRAVEDPHQAAVPPAWGNELPSSAAAFSAQSSKE